MYVRCGSLGDGRPRQRSFTKAFVPTASSRAMRTCGVRSFPHRFHPNDQQMVALAVALFEGLYANVTGKE